MFRSYVILLVSVYFSNYVNADCCGVYEEVLCPDGVVMNNVCLDCTPPRIQQKFAGYCGIDDCNVYGCECTCKEPHPNTRIIVRKKSEQEDEYHEEVEEVPQSTTKMLTISNPTTSKTSNPNIPNIFSSTTLVSSFQASPVNQPLEKPYNNLIWVIVGMFSFMAIFFIFLTILVIYMFKNFARNNSNTSNNNSANPDRTSATHLYDQPVYSYSDLINRVEGTVSYVNSSVELERKATLLQRIRALDEDDKADKCHNLLVLSLKTKFDNSPVRVYAKRDERRSFVN